MFIGVRDLDIITEDIIESHFKRIDARAPDLLFLKLAQPFAAVLLNVAQGVEFGVVTPLNDLTFVIGKRDVGADRFFQKAAQIRNVVESKERVLGSGRRGSLL